VDVPRRNRLERRGTPLGRRKRPPSNGREVIGVEIVILESEADQIDPELVRHVP
jgi:hypothetical protein